MQLSKPFETYFNAKLPFVFIAIVAIYALALTIEFKYIFTDEFYHHALDNKSNSNSPEKIAQFINKDRQSEWVNYPIILIIVLVPATIITFILFIGSFLREYKIAFKNIFSIVLKAQIVFALNYFLSIIFRLIGIVDLTRDVNNNYKYQSILVFFKVENIPTFLRYPMQSINLTEMLHLLILSFGMFQILNIGYLKTLSFTSLYYGLGLIFWLVFVTFINTIL